MAPYLVQRRPRFAFLAIALLLSCSDAFMRSIPCPQVNESREGELPAMRHPRSCLFYSPRNNDEQSSYQEDDGEDEDRDAPPNQAYGNRSLEWTKKYRSVIPYEKARKSAMDLGLRSKQEWDEYVSDGKAYHGPYLPNRPDEMYAEEWISWDEFLGFMRPYSETRHIVTNVLMIKTMEEYTDFVYSAPKRAEGLRIPAIPAKVYKDKGWISQDHFFGTTE